MSVSELVRDLLDQALAKSEGRRLDRIYEAMEQVKGACKDNVSDASVTIDEILYGERGAWREVSSNRQVLVDSDAFVGWLYETDTHHDTAVATFTRIKRERLTPVTSSLVVVETATVLSHRKGQALANIFLDMVRRFPVVHINEQLQREALTIFREQKARGTSVVDCSNVALMRRLHISRIFSFDKVYPKRFGFQTV